MDWLLNKKILRSSLSPRYQTAPSRNASLYFLDVHDGKLWVLWFIKDSFFISPELSHKFHWLIDWLIYHDDRGKVHQMKEYASYWGNKIAMTMYNIPKNSEKWVESKCENIEMLGIVPGTWFGKKQNVKISNILFHDILYTVRFVKMRRIQWYHLYYVKRVGKRPPRENTIL